MVLRRKGLQNPAGSADRPWARRVNLSDPQSAHPKDRRTWPPAEVTRTQGTNILGCPQPACLTGSSLLQNPRVRNSRACRPLPTSPPAPFTSELGLGRTSLRERKQAFPPVCSRTTGALWHGSAAPATCFCLFRISLAPSRAPNNERARCGAHYGPGGVTAFCSAPGHALVSNPLASGSLPGGNSPACLPTQSHQRHLLWAGLSTNVWRFCLSHFVQVLTLGQWLAVPGTRFQALPGLQGLLWDVAATGRRHNALSPAQRLPRRGSRASRGLHVFMRM